MLSGVISPLIYRPGEFIFQCRIFLPFHTVMSLGWVILSKVVPCPFPSCYSSNYLLPSGGGSQGPRTKARREKEWENQGAHGIGRKSAGGHLQCHLCICSHTCPPNALLTLPTSLLYCCTYLYSPSCFAGHIMSAQ